MRRWILKSAVDVCDVEEWLDSWVAKYPPDRTVMDCIIREHKDSRNLEQNAALWAALTDIAEQVVWHGQKYTPEDWKEIMTAGWKTQRFAPGIEGGIVALGISTSRMTKEDFSELLEYVIAWGVEQGVKFGAPAE